MSGIAGIKYGVDHINQMKSEWHGNRPVMQDGAADHVLKTAVTGAATAFGGWVAGGLLLKGAQSLGSVAKAMTSSTPKTAKLLPSSTGSKEIVAFVPKGQRGSINHDLIESLFFNSDPSRRAIAMGAGFWSSVGAGKSVYDWDPKESIGHNLTRTGLNTMASAWVGAMFPYAAIPTAGTTVLSYAIGFGDGIMKDKSE